MPSHAPSPPAAAQQQALQGQADLCTVCQCSKLTFEPPVLYCSTCGQRIKRGQTYYATPPEQPDASLKGCWCHQCFTDSKERLSVFGTVSARSWAWGRVVCASRPASTRG